MALRCALAFLAFCLGCMPALAESVGTVGLLRHIQVEGVDYVEKTDITAVLLLGIDRRGALDTSAGRYRQGGQADFQMLVVLDHAARQVHRLQIDRDCMTGIDAVGLSGNVTGRYAAQLCLAYAMGDGGKMSCDLAVDAVSRLLLDTEIPLYAAIGMDGIGAINDVLGGVTVTLPEDYTVYDPEMEAGRTLTLTAQQAEYMVRGRMEISDGTNESRMRRQQVFIAAAQEQLRQRLKENVNFADALLDALDGVMVSNIARGRMINELNRAYRYDILPVETLAGEYITGKDGFGEFYADAEALSAWVLKVFYAPAD